MKMKNFIGGATAFLILLGCNAQTEQIDLDNLTSEVPIQDSSDTVRTAGGLPVIETDVKPSFTQDTVTKLNAIVKRSLDSIETYDSQIDDIRNSVNMASKNAADMQARKTALDDIEKLKMLHNKAKLAKADLLSAKAELEAGDEFYNPVLLGGMERFVEKVDTQLSQELSALKSTLDL